eukprot:6184626-Pleurochrysis_carterae.AAC.1
MGRTCVKHSSDREVGRGSEGSAARLCERRSQRSERRAHFVLPLLLVGGVLAPCVEAPERERAEHARAGASHRIARLGVVLPRAQRRRALAQQAVRGGATCEANRRERRVPRVEGELQRVAHDAPARLAHRRRREQPRRRRAPAVQRVHQHQVERARHEGGLLLRRRRRRRPARVRAAPHQPLQLAPRLPRAERAREGTALRRQTTQRGRRALARLQRLDRARVPRVHGAHRRTVEERAERAALQRLGVPDRLERAQKLHLLHQRPVEKCTTSWTRRLARVDPADKGAAHWLGRAQRAARQLARVRARVHA